MTTTGLFVRPRFVELESSTSENRNRWITQEARVLVRTRTAIEDRAPYRCLCANESASSAKTYARIVGVGNFLIRRHLDSLQSIDHD
jgi:hypothetical protein